VPIPNHNKEMKEKFIKACEECKSINAMIRKLGLNRSKLLRLEIKYETVMPRRKCEGNDITKEKLIDVCDKAISLSEICAETGYSYSKIRRLLAAYDLDFVSKYENGWHSYYDYEAVYQIFLDNDRNLTHAAKQVGCSITVVYNAIRYHKRKQNGND